MRAALEFNDPEGNTSVAKPGERRSVVHSKFELGPSGREWELNTRRAVLSLAIKNDGAVESSQDMAVELLDKDDVVIQRTVIYAQRAYIIPVPVNITQIRATNQTLDSFTVTITVF